MKTSVLICDNPSNLREGYNCVIYWESFYEGKNILSVPRMVETNATELRNKYLEWIYRLGRVEFEKKSVAEHLLIRDDFSYWWMTLLIEKSQWKSESLYKAIRLLALDLLLKERNPDQVDIVLSDPYICKSIKQYCLNNKIKFKNFYPNKEYFFNLWRENISPLFHVANALRLLLSIFFCLYKDNSNIEKNTTKTKSDFVFVSYLFNLDKAAINKKIFSTFYWTSLHSLLSESIYKIKWIHIFIKHDDIQTLKEAQELINQFNIKSSNQSHLILEKEAGWPIFKSVVLDYIKLLFIAWRSRRIKEFFKESDNGFNLWYLMQADYRSSLLGKTAIVNCFSLNLFEDVLSKYPLNKKCFYLMENQSWERGLIYAWRKAGCGQIIGVQHAAISFWDLRHYFSPLEYTNNHDINLPVPDKVALNGNSAIELYTSAGFPADNIVCVEALRYLYLQKSKRNISCGFTSKVLRILVLTDYSREVTNKQLQLLSKAVNFFPSSFKLLLKCHPANPVNVYDWPNLKIKVTDKPLDKLVDMYDVAYTSSSTSSVLDAYLLGKRVFVMLDPSTFNMTPIKGMPDVEYVSKPDDLIEKITNKNKKIDVDMSNFFFTENTLPLWKGLISGSKR